MVSQSKLIYSLFFLCFIEVTSAQSQKLGDLREVSADTAIIDVDERYISIDNVCAWPNLTVLPDGTFVATIFNQPSHAKVEGNAECWASKDGHFWEKRGTPAPHDPGTNRMNLAAGLANNDDLLVIVSGWTLKDPKEPGGVPYGTDEVLRPWVSRSSDGGRTWSVRKEAFPSAERGWSEFIPFGDIIPGEDGTLRVLAYSRSSDLETNKVAMFQSKNDGQNWEAMSTISDGSNGPEFLKGHNETAFFHLGDGRWIAAARRWRAGQALDLFRSNDDGKTWRYDTQLTEPGQHPAHLVRLHNDNLLLTYGNRIEGEYGVAAKISQDEGKTWDEEFLIIDDLESGDSGYPTSVQLSNGKILTAYYSAGVAPHQRYHMGSVIWNLPEDE